MNYFSNNDYELIYLIKEDNEDALDIVFKKYEPLIKKMANEYYDNYKSYKIEYDDLVQEGRIGLCQAINGFNPSKDVLFFTFAFLCIKRQLIDYTLSFRRQKNKVLNKALSIELPDIKEPINYEDPLTLISNNIIINNLINFKNSLDYIDSNIFELRFNSFSYKEIAMLLDVSVKVVDNRLIKIRKKLKKYLLELT